MKNLSLRLDVLLKQILLVLILGLSYGVYAQDLIIKADGDSINVKILEVTEDSLMLSTEVDGEMVNTWLPISEVKTIEPGYYETIESDTAEYYQIETTDGNVYIGQILSQEGGLITVRTLKIGDITLSTDDVESMKRIEANVAMSDGARWFDYLRSSRYFYAPSGYGLRKGDAYYQNVWILFNQFSMGFSDVFSAGVGMVPLFLFDGSPTPVWVTPKLSLPVVKNKFNLGVGALMGGVIGLDDIDGSGFGVLYGIATIGDRDKNLSLGLGYGYAGGEFAQQPAISLSGMVPVGKRTFLITENYLIDDVGLLSVGGRSLIRKITLDYGLFIPAEGGSFFAIPWLGIVIPIETGLK